MQRLTNLSFLILLLLVACTPEAPDVQPGEAETLPSDLITVRSKGAIPGKYIVSLQPGTEVFESLPGENRNTEHPDASLLSDAQKRIRLKPVRELSRKILAAHNLADTQMENVFDIGDVKGFMFVGSQREAKELEADPNIGSVEADKLIALGLDPHIKSSLIPTSHDDGDGVDNPESGVNRVGGSVDMNSSQYWAFIIDSGIDLDHPDLNVLEQAAVSFIPNESPEDMLGHGTHVAGIVGAKDNGIGIVGVAAGVPVVPVKVLDQQGDGATSNLLMAIDYVKMWSIPGDVVNISLGTDKSPAIDAAIRSLVSDYGVKVVIAAGNTGMSTYHLSPANVMEDGIYVVGALGLFDFPAFWSNYGASVNYIAPGLAIKSTYKNGKYAWMSGTSMAAPHVAGLLISNNLQIRDNGYKRMKDGRNVAVPGR
ncbi:MAG: S8 family serine peptidase [Bacteroidota bacterium]